MPFLESETKSREKGVAPPPITKMGKTREKQPAFPWYIDIVQRSKVLPIRRPLTISSVGGFLMPWGRNSNKAHKRKEVVRMAANWKKIRSEYIKGGTTYRALAEKYGVSPSSVEKRAAKEQWTATRENRLQETYQKIEEKTAEKIAENESDVAAIMSRIRLKLTQKIEEAVDKLEEIDTGELRKLVQSFKDMSEARSGTEEEKTGVLNDILDAVRGVSDD